MHYTDEVTMFFGLMLFAILFMLCFMLDRIRDLKKQLDEESFRIRQDFAEELSMREVLSPTDVYEETRRRLVERRHERDEGEKKPFPLFPQFKFTLKNNKGEDITDEVVW